MIFSDTRWINLFEAELQKNIKNLLDKGVDIASNIWKEVLNSWILIISETRQENMNVPYERIWFNPKIKVLFQC